MKAQEVRIKQDEGLSKSSVHFGDRSCLESTLQECLFKEVDDAQWGQVPGAIT